MDQNHRPVTLALIRTLRVAVVLGLVSVAAAQSPPDATDVAGAARSAFADAVSAYRAGRIDEAIERMRRVVDLAPDDADALWNLGLWLAEAARPIDALGTWLRYREVRPDDWHARAKTIQAYQALGRETARDRERRALYALRAQHPDGSLARAESFCRDQFVVAGQRVMTFERFEPAGPRAVVLELIVLDDAGGERLRYQLASPDRDNVLAWDDAAHSRDHRTYRLTRRGPTGNATVTWYEGRPSYERVRRDASRHLSAELRGSSADGDDPAAR